MASALGRLFVDPLVKFAKFWFTVGRPMAEFIDRPVGDQYVLHCPIAHSIHFLVNRCLFPFFVLCAKLSVPYPKVERWCLDGINHRRGQLASAGRDVPSSVVLHSRPLGRPAASGRRQLLFTSANLDVAKLGIEECWSWWTECSADIDPREWRYVSCRWFQR